MKTKLIAIAIANLLLVSGSASFADELKPAAAFDGTVAFARLKALAGDWEAETGMGKVQVTYRLIAGGTAVQESERSEKMPEMLTVYYMDGKRLLLTHYCLTGNQPRMEAKAYDPETGELQFRFLDATNLAMPGVGHMHYATIRFIDEKQVASDWQFYENGRLKMSEKVQLSRVQ